MERPLVGETLVPGKTAWRASMRTDSSVTGLVVPLSAAMTAVGKQAQAINAIALSTVCILYPGNGGEAQVARPET